MANKLSRFVCVCFVSVFIVIPGYEYAYRNPWSVKCVGSDAQSQAGNANDAKSVSE